MTTENQNLLKPIGLLGGTFDPVHNGHLRLAVELYERLNLAEVRFIPSAYPPHRDQPVASAQLRLKMVQEAVKEVKGLAVDARELERPGPSYMVDTLCSLREDFPIEPLYMILGMDAYVNLCYWHQWERLIEYAHLLVVRRPGKLLPTMSHIMQEFLTTRQPKSPADLSKPAGTIFVEEIPALTISSTQIRGIIATDKNPRYLLPSSVLNIIETHQLYH